VNALLRQPLAIGVGAVAAVGATQLDAAWLEPRTMPFAVTPA
jgi:hypothetical protein